MQFYAKDIMTTELITVTPFMTCKQLEELIVSEKISGCPVVDDNGRMVGVISIHDVIESNYHNNFYLNDRGMPYNNTVLSQHHYDDLVSDHMNRVIYTATPDTTVQELAKIMHDNHIHRVIVTEPDSNKPLGIISTFDLLKLLAEKPTLTPQA